MDITNRNHLFQPFCIETLSNDCYKIGKKYYDSTNYKDALSGFTEDAEQYDHVMSQFYLGSMYRKGQGTTQDYSKGIIWYTRARYNGDKDAQYYVEIIYLDGKPGVNKEYKEALQWFQRADADINPHQRL